MCNDPRLYFVNFNTHVKFGEILSICSQDNGRKQNFGADFCLAADYLCTTAIRMEDIAHLFIKAAYSVLLCQRRVTVT